MTGWRGCRSVGLAVVLAGVVGGCGGTGATSSPGAAPVSGRAVFAEHCAICHSISGTPSRNQQGGDLRGLRLPRPELVQFTVEMPVIHRRLTSREVRAVVDYMQSLAHR